MVIENVTICPNLNLLNSTKTLLTPKMSITIQRNLILYSVYFYIDVQIFNNKSKMGIQLPRTFPLKSHLFKKKLVKNYFDFLKG